MTIKHHIVKMMMMMGCMIGTIGQVCWAEETIHWFTVNYPPAYFVEGKRQGEGFCEAAGEQFRHTLATYQHQLIADVSIPRMLEFWKETDSTYCVPGLGVTIGQFPHTVYSKSLSIVPPAGIMIRKTERHRFVTPNKEQASLEQLLHDSTLVFGVFTEGQFGERIDALIKQYKGKPNLYERPHIDVAALFKMLAHKRVDYAVTFAFAVQTAFDVLAPEERNALLFVPVIEADAPKDVHAICNDTPLGRQVIEQINQVLTTEAYKTVVTERLIEFLPENLRAEYQSLNVQHIGQ